jgi:hypothetical protein
MRVPTKKLTGCCHHVANTPLKISKSHSIQNGAIHNGTTPTGSQVQNLIMYNLSKMNCLMTHLSISDYGAAANLDLFLQSQL